MKFIRFFYVHVCLPLLRMIIRAVLMPGLMLDDLAARMRLARQGDVVSIEQISKEDGGAFCVFHLYQPRGLSPNVVKAISALAELKVRVVAVSNVPLQPGDLDVLRPHIHTFIQRRNFGRDFGGYRRGVLHVLDTYKPDRVILLNDSVYYAARGLKAFFTGLCEGGPFVGASENHELRHHIGSYAVSFGQQVVADPRFRQYWEDYRSTEIRPTVIWKGEAALSKLILDTMKIRPRVIYSLQRLEAALNQANWRQLAVSAARMPRDYEGQNPLQQLVREARRPMRDELPISRSALLDIASLTLPLTTDELAAELSQQNRRELQRDLLGYVYRGSQIHWGSLLLTQYLEMPIIKLDLVLRSIYKIGELGNFAPFLSEEEFAEFHALVTSRGEPLTHGSLKQKLMMMTGLM